MKEKASDPKSGEVQERIRQQLVQIKWILATILFVLCLAIVGVGHAVQLLTAMVIVAALGGGAIYAGLYVFERLVRMKTGNSDADSQLRDYLAWVESGNGDADTEDPEDRSRS